MYESILQTQIIRMLLKLALIRENIHAIITFALLIGIKQRESSQHCLFAQELVISQKINGGTGIHLAFLRLKSQALMTNV